MSAVAQTASAPTTEPAPERRYIYVVEGSPTTDALVRILDPFAVQQAVLEEVSSHADADTITVRIVAGGLSPLRADHLAERLRRSPAIVRVALGWRCAAPRDS